MVMIRGAVAKVAVATVVVAADGSGDTTDIQTGIDLLSAGGGVVYMREGTYTITATITIPSNVSIKGSGYSTYIYLANNSNTPMISNEDTLTGNSHITIEDIRFGGNKGNQTSGVIIRFVTVTYSTIRGCWVENARAEGIFMQDCEFCTILNNDVTGSTTTGIYVYQLSNNNTVTNNIIDSNTGSGLFVFDRCNDNVISSNQSKSNALGIYVFVDCNRNVLTGNICNSNSEYGIYVKGSDCDNNIVLGNITNGNSIGNFLDTGTNTVIGFNIIDTSGNIYHKGRFVKIP